MDPVGQKRLSQQENSGCYMKETKKADKTMKPKRISKEEKLRLMEEKKKLKEVSLVHRITYILCIYWRSFTFGFSNIAREVA